MTQVGTDVTVGDLAYTEGAEHSLVLFDLVLLEFVNGHVSVLDSDEVDKFAVVLNGMVSSLDVGLKGQLGVVLGALTLEEVLETGLTHFQFVKLGLVVASLLFGCHLGAHDVLTSGESTEETLHVELLSLEPDVGFGVGVVDLVEGIDNFLLDIANSRVSHGALRHVTVGVVIDGDIFVLHEGVVHSQVVILEFVLVGLHLFDVVFGFLLKHEIRKNNIAYLHHHIGLLKESSERVDLLPILGDLSSVLVFIDLEVKSELL
jgi:hypothetical protein